MLESLADGAIPGRRKALDQSVQITKAFGPGADPYKPIGIKELLAACDATPASHSPGQACLVLRWGGRGFHFNRFFPLRDTNRHDANFAPGLGRTRIVPFRISCRM